MKPITQIVLNLTDDCNLKCKYCFVEQHPHRMSYKVAEDAVEWVLKNAKEVDEEQPPAVGFFGGEPALEWDTIIVPIVKKYFGKVNFSITSNTTLMTEERLKFLAEHNVEYLFSIDGNKYCQDINRPTKNNTSSFDLLEDKLDLVSKYFPNCTFRSTITPETCHLMYENIKFATEHGYKMVFQIPNFFGEWNEEHQKEIAKQLRMYSLYLINCFINDYPFTRYFLFELAMKKVYQMLYFQENGNKTDVKSKYKCGLGSGHYASINYEGKIFACQEMDSRNDGDYFHIGDIYNGRDEAKVQKIINDFLKEDNHSEYCGKCILKTICANNCCVANNYIQYKDINRCNPMTCWWDNQLVKEVLFVCNVLGNGKNQKFKDYFLDIGRGERW